MAPLLDRVVGRRLTEVVRQRMASEPIVILQGARAVGKSTLLRALADSRRRPVIDLDDLATRDAVGADPMLFVADEPPVLIDEFQHVPELLDAIKAELNRDSSPGRFVITGSTRYEPGPRAIVLRRGAPSILTVAPLSQGEVGEAREDFAELLVRAPRELLNRRPTATTRPEYIGRVVAGGFPMPLRRSRLADRSRWFDDYVDMVLERDVLDIANVRQRRQLPRLVRQLASQSGQILNVAKAAAAVGMEESTAEDHVRLLEAVFLVHRLPAWGTTLGSRVGARPKIHVVDSGLGARLLRLTESKLAAASAPALTGLGHLLETFVVGEVSKQLDWLDEPVARGHWRTHDGEEVDLVVEREDGMVVGVEVKAGSRVSEGDVKGLRSLRRRVGASGFLGGLVLYTGAHSYALEPDLLVVPVDRLWKTRGR